MKTFKKWKNDIQSFNEYNEWLCRVCNVKYVWQRHGLFWRYECPVCHRYASKRLVKNDTKKELER